MKTMRITLTVALLLLTAMLSAQNSHLSIGVKGNGICLGNSSAYNGIRLNLWDKNVNSINGLTVSCLSESTISNGITVGCFTTGRKSNGLSLGFIVSNDTLSNGLKIGGIAARANRHNGIALALISLGGYKFNGIGASGFTIHADTLNGLFVSSGIAAWNSTDTLKVINGATVGVFGVGSVKMNGLAISILLNRFEKQKGVSIALINEADQLHGIQFGLINHAKNNRRLFRWMPIINFNFRKEC